MGTVSLAKEERALLSIAEVAQRTGLGRSTILKEAYAGNLKSVKVRARRLVHPADLNDWLDRLRNQADEAA